MTIQAPNDTTGSTAYRGGPRLMSPAAVPTTYRFSFGPWNISTGADPFGPPVRRELDFARKLKAYKELGFDAVQFHDDEIVAPRLWEDPRTIDGALTANSESDRKYALDRCRRAADIAREIGCKNYVL